MVLTLTPASARAGPPSGRPLGKPSLAAPVCGGPSGLCSPGGSLSVPPALSSPGPTAPPLRRSGGCTPITGAHTLSQGSEVAPLTPVLQPEPGDRALRLGPVFPGDPVGELGWPGCA